MESRKRRFALVTSEKMESTMGGRKVKVSAEAVDWWKKSSRGVETDGKWREEETEVGLGNG